MKIMAHTSPVYDYEYIQAGVVGDFLKKIVNGFGKYLNNVSKNSKYDVVVDDAKQNEDGTTDTKISISSYDGVTILQNGDEVPFEFVMKSQPKNDDKYVDLLFEWKESKLDFPIRNDFDNESDESLKIENGSMKFTNVKNDNQTISKAILTFIDKVFGEEFAKLYEQMQNSEQGDEDSGEVFDGNGDVGESSGDNDTISESKKLHMTLKPIKSTKSFDVKYIHSNYDAGESLIDLNNILDDMDFESFSDESEVKIDAYSTDDSIDYQYSDNVSLEYDYDYIIQILESMYKLYFDCVHYVINLYGFKQTNVKNLIESCLWDTRGQIRDLSEYLVQKYKVSIHPLEIISGIPYYTEEEALDEVAVSTLKLNINNLINQFDLYAYNFDEDYREIKIYNWRVMWDKFVNYIL